MTMELFGFVDPAGRYPALVSPVWRGKEGDLLGVIRSNTRNSRSEMQTWPVAGPGVIKLPEGWSDATIKGHEPRNIRLLALSAENVVGYPAAQEEGVLTTLLDDPSVAADEPLTRLALAKLSGSPSLIAAELQAAACHLLTLECAAGSSAAVRMEHWLRQEREAIAGLAFDCADFRALYAAFPTTLGDLGRPTWWRRHLTPTSGVPMTLAEIEDRTPSPSKVAVINIEPEVPDERILRIMARHLLAGASYVFFHSPSASTAALEALRQAGEQATQLAMNAPGGPLGKILPETIGTITFFRLSRQWTGSPYVFYEEASTLKGTRVVGYRGLDVGAAISRSYKQLPDSMAFEFLEAFVAEAPRAHVFQNVQHPAPPAGVGAIQEAVAALADRQHPPLQRN